MSLPSLPAGNVLFIAGYRADGHPDSELSSPARNKLAQNAARATVELETRARRLAFRQRAALGTLGVLLGILASAVQRLVSTRNSYEASGGIGPDRPRPASRRRRCPGASMGESSSTAA